MRRPRIPAPRFTTRAVAVSTACVALAVVFLRDFVVFMRSQDGDPPANAETWGYMIRYLIAGGLLGGAIGALFNRPVVWFLIGVLLSLAFACAGIAVAY